MRQTKVIRHLRKTRKGKVPVKHHYRKLKNRGAAIPWSEFKRKKIYLLGTKSEKQLLRKKISKQPELLPFLRRVSVYFAPPGDKYLGDKYDGRVVTEKSKENLPSYHLILNSNYRNPEFSRQIDATLRHEAKHLQQAKRAVKTRKYGEEYKQAQSDKLLKLFQELEAEHFEKKPKERILSREVSQEERGRAFRGLFK